MLVFEGEDVAVVVVVARACGGVAADAVEAVVTAGTGCLRDEAAVAVVAQVSGRLAVMVVLDGVHAAVLVVPDEFAVGVDGEDLWVAIAVQDVWRGARAVAVLVVVLDDQAAIGGFAQDFAVAVVGRDVFGGGVGGVGDVGFGGRGCVVHAGGLRLQDWRGVHVVGFRGGAAQGVQVVGSVQVMQVVGFVGGGGGFAVRFGKGGQVGSEGEQEGDGDVFVVHGGSWVICVCCSGTAQAGRRRLVVRLFCGCYRARWRGSRRWWLQSGIHARVRGRFLR